MAWRHPGWVRASRAWGIIFGALVATSMTAATAQDAVPQPVKPGTAATATVTATADNPSNGPISVLDAQRSGMLSVSISGAGADRVRVQMKNLSPRRLQVVMPPGLIASAATGQPGGGGAFQSMGLGGLGNRIGTFGGAPKIVPSETPSANDSVGFRSIPASPEPAADANANLGMAIPEGQSVDVLVPSVCLNYGVTTPTPRNKFRLVSSEEYSSDVRVGKALRNLHHLGTSQAVAQAAMWHICNNMTFEQIASVARGKINLHEVALAARFVSALKEIGDTSLINPEQFRSDRMFVKVDGSNALRADAARLQSELAGTSLLGLPVTIVSETAPAPVGSALLVVVQLDNANAKAKSAKDAPATVGKAQVLFHHGAGRWQTLGQIAFSDAARPNAINGASLSKVIDAELARTFVTVKAQRSAQGQTTFRLENRLPFTLHNAYLRTGDSFGAPEIELSELGIGPRRTGSETLPAAAARVTRVTVNGL